MYFQHAAHEALQGGSQRVALGDDVAHPFLLPPLGFLDVLFQRGHDQGLLAGKIRVQGADRYPGSLGNPVGGAGGIAPSLENLSSGPENRFHGFLGTPLYWWFSWS